MGNSSGSGILSSVENSTNNGNMLGGLGGLGGFGRLEKTHRATDVDWAYDGKMGDVKDQGGCGSCWAFAATTTLEGTHAIKSNQDPVHLSEQQIVDCTLTTNPDNERRFGKDYKAHGCEGGWMQWAWSFMKDHGVMRDSDYRYTSGNTGVETKCEHNEAKVVGKVEGYGQVTTSVEDVKRKLKQQPLAVAVRAD